MRARRAGFTPKGPLCPLAWRGGGRALACPCWKDFLGHFAAGTAFCRGMLCASLIGAARWKPPSTGTPCRSSAVGLGRAFCIFPLYLVQSHGVRGISEPPSPGSTAGVTSSRAPHAPASGAGRGEEHRELPTNQEVIRLLYPPEISGFPQSTQTPNPRQRLRFLAAAGDTHTHTHGWGHPGSRLPPGASVEALPTVGRRPGLIKIALGGIKEGKKKKKKQQEENKGQPKEGVPKLWVERRGLPMGMRNGAQRWQRRVPTAGAHGRR